MYLFREDGRPGPECLRMLRNVGMGMAAAGGAILTSPLELPETLTNFGGYMMISGLLTSIICQALIRDGEDPGEGSAGAFVAPGPNPLLDPDR